MSLFVIHSVLAAILFTINQLLGKVKTEVFHPIEEKNVSRQIHFSSSNEIGRYEKINYEWKFNP